MQATTQTTVDHLYALARLAASKATNEGASLVERREQAVIIHVASADAARDVVVACMHPAVTADFSLCTEPYPHREGWTHRVILATL
jgi:hypothetical protein